MVSLALATAVLVPGIASATPTLTTPSASVISMTATTTPMSYADQKKAWTLRALYYSQLNTARTNYKNSKLDYPGMPSSYPVTFAAVVAKANTRINAASTRLGAARTLAEYAAVAPAIKAELALSKVHGQVVHLAADALSARAAAIAAGQTATRNLVAGSITDAQYAPIAEASGRVAALAAADLVRVKAATGGTAYPSPSTAALWVAALDGSIQVPQTSDFVAIPGSCALPVADAAWVGTATEPGLHQWVTDADVAAAKDRIANKDAAFLATHKELTRLSTKVMTTSTITLATDLRLRTQRLGYLWLVNGDATARRQLSAEATRIISAGPSGAPLTDAGVIEAAATALDWTDWNGAASTTASTASNATNATVMRSLWLGSFACMFQDQINVGKPDNISFVYGSSTFQLGIYLAKSDPTIGAAVAKAAWTSMQPNFMALSDGGWYEGPAYWNLMGRAVVGAVGTAQNIYGTTSPATIPDLSATADFMWNATAANGDLPNFSDTTADVLRPNFASLVARTTDSATAMPSLRDRLLGVDRIHPAPTEGFEVLWWPSATAWSLPTPAKKSAVYSKTGLATVQGSTATAWLKGSPRYLSHTHLDVGSVGLTANGVEWTVDPGKGNYSAPGYFALASTSPRWNDFKVSADAHSTVTGPGRPVIGASAALSASGSSMAVDLQRTISGSRTATRTVSLASSSMTMVDSLTGTAPRVWNWHWVTEAAVSVGGTATAPRFTLTSGTQHITVTVTGLPAGSVVTHTHSGTTSASGLPITVIQITTPATSSVRFTTVARW